MHHHPISTSTHNSEGEALLPEDNPQQPSARSTRSFSRWVAHPFWLIPVVLVFSMSRGITMSPRIQVYRAIACRTLPLLDDTTGVVGLVASPDCESSDVQARAAKIQAAVVTLMSVLSAITTGFWSRLGDIHGRKPILIIFLAGAIAMEVVFMLVMRPNSFFGRRAEQLILVGPVVEGLVGGISTFNGIFHAYVSDCTRPGSRSKIFSTIQGIVFVGLALGPWFGGLFLPKTGYSDSFFFCSIALLIGSVLYVLFICPESRFPSAETNDSFAGDFLKLKTSPIQATYRLLSRFIYALLSPIAIFTPHRIRGSNNKTWNMTLVGLCFFLYSLSIGIFSAKYLYAQHVYSWTTSQLGYYMSALWFTRALNLLVVLPIIISYLKPKPTSPLGTQPSPSDVVAELVFDQRLAQISLFVDGFADAVVAVISNKSQPLFVIVSCLSSFTSGGNPALHSLGAICLHSLGFSDQVGALFGAMGVLNSIAHSISPTIFATTYGATVGSFPQAIFILSACLLFAVVTLLIGIRPIHMSPTADHEGVVVDPEVGENGIEDDMLYTDSVDVDASGVPWARTRSQSPEFRRGRDSVNRMGSVSSKYDAVGTSPPRIAARDSIEVESR